MKHALRIPECTNVGTSRVIQSPLSPLDKDQKLAEYCLGAAAINSAFGTSVHEEIAERIGTSRETVTRLFAELKRRQIVQVNGATLLICNRPALEALALAGL